MQELKPKRNFINIRAAPDRRLGETCSVGGFVLRSESVRLWVWSITFVSIGLWTLPSWWRQSRAAHETDLLLIFLQVRKKWIWCLEMEKLNLSPSLCKLIFLASYQTKPSKRARPTPDPWRARPVLWFKAQTFTCMYLADAFIQSNTRGNINLKSAALQSFTIAQKSTAWNRDERQSNNNGRVLYFYF